VSLSLTQGAARLLLEQLNGGDALNMENENGEQPLDLAKTPDIKKYMVHRMNEVRNVASADRSSRVTVPR
jgi:hypothetical protein